MGAHADILRSLIVELERFERSVAVFTRENEHRVVAARIHMDNAAAQLLSRSEDAPVRENGSLLPSDRPRFF